METVSLLGSAMGLGFVSGLNLYATVLTVGLGIRFHLIVLNPELAKLEILASPYILIAAGVIYLVEFFADKIPWIDSLWDAIHTLIRPLGAAALGATAIGSVDSQAAVVAVLCGGVALSGHSAKAGTRLLANHSPEPFSNIGLSLGEDILVVVGTWLSMRHPMVMLTLVIIFLAVFVWFAPKAFRLMRVEYLAALALLKRLYATAKQYEYSFSKQRELVGAGSNFNISVDGSDAATYGGSSNPDLIEDMPEHYLHYLDNKIQLQGKQACVRCVAGKGIKGLRHSVGYLHLTNDNLIFVTRRFFRFHDHQINRNSIEDVHLKKRILLDRIILRTEGKQQQFFFFKDTSNRGEKVFDILQVHKKQR
jgi:hypothetical protein